VTIDCSLVNRECAFNRSKFFTRRRRRVEDEEGRRPCEAQQLLLAERPNDPGAQSTMSRLSDSGFRRLVEKRRRRRGIDRRRPGDASANRPTGT